MTCKETTTTVWNGWCPSGSSLHTALARQVVVACKDRGSCLARIEFLGIILSELVL